MRRSKTLKSTDGPGGKSTSAEGMAIRATAPEAEWVNGNDKKVDNFLYPPMPGSFDPWAIRQLPVEKLRDRYIQVLSASMANHSLALYYCCWSQAQFAAAADEEFLLRIAEARSQIADRAAFILHRGIGLVASADSGKESLAVTAVMAKVVSELNADKSLAVNSTRAYKLTVDGLHRPAKVAAKVGVQTDKKAKHGVTVESVVAPVAPPEVDF